MSDDEEMKALRAEWAKAQGWGKTRERDKLKAMVASVGAAGVVMVTVVVVGLVLDFDPRKVVVAAFVLGGSVGWPIRQKLWPKGQFS